jgi:gamma-glutamylcyclotransferase (GGCT)/AIG2-like uncharacterized protein YtfP
MQNVFTYGSLMFAPVWQKVVRGTYASVAADAPGLARFRVRGEPYPGSLLKADAITQGRVYFQVSAHDCKRLDDFEGAHYARGRILLTLPDSGQSLDAWTYLYLRPHALEATPWDPLAFERNDMQRFLDTYSPTR